MERHIMTTQNSAMGDEDLKQELGFAIAHGTYMDEEARESEFNKIWEAITSRDKQIALEAKIERLDTGKHVAFQIIDGVNAHQLHEVFVDQLIKAKAELATLKQAQNKEK